MEKKKKRPHRHADTKRHDILDENFKQRFVPMATGAPGILPTHPTPASSPNWGHRQGRRGSNNNCSVLWQGMQPLTQAAVPKHLCLAKNLGPSKPEGMPADTRLKSRDLCLGTWSVVTGPTQRHPVKESSFQGRMNWPKAFCPAGFTRDRPYFLVPVTCQTLLLFCLLKLPFIKVG